MSRPPISAVVTTCNNAGTLDACLSSLAFCDEILVLDSGSEDATAEIAVRHRARWFVEPFKGYGPQKQAAIDKATHDWVLLLDADEFLEAGASDIIQTELTAPRAEGYRLPRRDWLFWRWPHPRTRPNWQLRLFRRSCGSMNDVPVHAEPNVRGTVCDLQAHMRHYGEPDLAARVEKVNRYSTGMVESKRRRQPRFLPLRIVLYPAFMFFRLYVVKLYFLNGWAGYFAARTQSYYAFLKYAKVLEAGRKEQR
jgi:glycosyltransferase involved in cell wall biosynthesis